MIRKSIHHSIHFLFNCRLIPSDGPKLNGQLRTKLNVKSGRSWIEVDIMDGSADSELVFTLKDRSL